MIKPLSLLFVSSLLCAAQLSALTGREIVEEQDSRHASDSEYSRANMKIIDRRGKEKKRVIHNWAAKNEEGLNRTLMKFSSPTDINNVGVLTWEQAGEAEDDQWLSFPATKQVKRITGGSKKNLFMGTDLAYEDMRSLDLDAHTFTVVREETHEESDCWVIEALPATAKEKKESGYSKRLIWIRKDNYLTVKTEFYGRNKKVAKVGTFSNPIQIDGNLWRNRTTKMERLTSQTTTIMAMTKLQINEEVDMSLLTQQGLKRSIVDE
ncbi:MAG: outer membrane lipoprotein-sorting protein [Opitutaceae bacterium]